MHYLQKNFVSNIYNIHLAEEKYMKRVIICIILNLVMLNCIHASTYYVKTNGNNLLSGTNWSEAWQTISCAATNATNPGDIVYVADGNYNEQVVIKVNGTAANNIVFSGTNTNCLAVLRSPMNNTLYLSNSTYVKIKYFTIKESQNSIRVYLGNNNYIIRNYVVNNTNGIIISSPNSQII